MNKRIQDVLEKYKGSHDIEKSDISYVLLEEILTNRFEMEESNRLFLEKTKEILEKMDDIDKKMDAFSSRFNEGDFEIGMESIELKIDYVKIAQEVANVLEKKEE